jgi:hypothetical protein
MMRGLTVKLNEKETLCVMTKAVLRLLTRVPHKKSNDPIIICPSIRIIYQLGKLQLILRKIYVLMLTVVNAKKYVTFT